MIGREILGYRVDEKIGSGGFGTVYMVSKTNAAGTYVRALKHITIPTKKQYASVTILWAAIMLRQMTILQVR